MRWPEAIPLKDSSKISVAKDTISELSQLLGSHKLRTTAYQQQSNDLVERFHRKLKDTTRQNSNNWLDELPLILLGLRTAIKADLGCSPAELVYGKTLKVPGDFFVESEYNNYNPTYFLLKLR